MLWCCMLWHPVWLTRGNHHIPDIIKYLKRLDAQEFAAFAVKDAVNRDIELKKSEAVRQWIITDGKQLIL